MAMAHSFRYLALSAAGAMAIRLPATSSSTYTSSASVPLANTSNTFRASSRLSPGGRPCIIRSTSSRLSLTAAAPGASRRDPADRRARQGGRVARRGFGADSLRGGLSPWRPPSATRSQRIPLNRNPEGGQGPLSFSWRPAGGDGTMASMVGRRRALAGLALLGLAACAAPLAVTPPRPVALGSEPEGLASWYGHPYHGRRTASGEIYDMNDLTAAHPTMPLGVRVAVTNLDNGRTAEVRINDRGPFVDGRILDLSYAAARVLGADRAGVFPVRIRVVALPGSVDTPAGTGFTVQVGAFASRAAAASLRDVMSKARGPA